MKHKIYLDDIRTPIDKSWIVVRSYEEFVEKLPNIGLNVGYKTVVLTIADNVR